jgi:hypothetical protein
MSLGLWFHKLFHVHCSECKLDNECENCNTLRMLLEQERAVNKRLIDTLLAKPEIETIGKEEEEIKPVQISHIPWRVKKQILEKEDFDRAVDTRRKREIEELEKKMGINNGNSERSKTSETPQDKESTEDQIRSTEVANVS